MYTGIPMGRALCVCRYPWQPECATLVALRLAARRHWWQGWRERSAQPRH